VLASGISAALLVSVALFALTTLTLAGMRGLPGPAVQRTPAAGRLGAALRHAVVHPAIRSLLGLQAAALLFFTISIPVEVVFAQHSLHAGAGGYGGLLASWGAGSIAGSLIYARWRRRTARALITFGAGALGLGFVGMALSPTLTVALLCAALAGSGNGIEAVAARTALQERVEAGWMTLMMSLNESMFQAVPGAGILLGGALAAIGSPRLALAVAGTGALAVTAAAWIVLRPDTTSGPPAAPLGPGGADGHDVVNGRRGTVSGAPTSAGRGSALG
jgi:MFS family permease